MVAGLGGPTTLEHVASLTTRLEEREQVGKGAEVKNLISSDPPLPSSEPLEEDDDEEVSWQNAARASLEKETKTPVKSTSTSVPRKVENLSPKVEAKPVETGTASASNLKPQTPNPGPPQVTEQFTQEELPADFWGSEVEPPPVSSYDDETFETATSTSSNQQNAKARANPNKGAKLPFEMPLFNELQSLFPGRIVRIDVKQQKQAEESEESTESANEAVNAAESEESVISDE